MTFLAAALIGFSIILLALATHPFVTYPLSLRIIARLRPCPIRPGPVPESIALCVCAYNEDQVIRAKIANMVELKEVFPALELYIYVDAATDNTTSIVLEFKEQVKCIVADKRYGKTYGMNTLLEHSSADIVVFSDANVMFDRQAIGRLINPFQDDAVGAVCGHLIYLPENSSATAQTGSAYWRLEEKIKALESETGSVMGADGSIFAIRRSLHRPPPPDLIDDMFVSLSVLIMGYRVVRANDAFAYERSVSRSGEEFHRKIRIACQAFNVHRVLWPCLRKMPALDKYKYISHKLLRWFTIYLLLSSLMCFLFGTLANRYNGLAFSSAVLIILSSGLLVWFPDQRVRKLRDIFGAFLATGIGVWKSLAGERFQTWNPPASARGFSAKSNTKIEST